jgi:hypothetical protein
VDGASAEGTQRLTLRQPESGSSSVEHPASGYGGHDFAFRILLICESAFVVALLMLARFVRIAVHIVLSRLELSTLAQFGAAGTNQLYFAARANGASDGFFALTLSSVVELAMLPAFAISVSEAVPVKA